MRGGRANSENLVGITVVFLPARNAAHNAAGRLHLSKLSLPVGRQGSKICNFMLDMRFKRVTRKKKKIFRRLARVHFLLTVIAFGFYLSLSFFLGPKFLLSDLKEKFHVLADDIITVTARVLDPPVQPVVTATPVCVTGAPRVNLDWADDDNTITWDIERDGLPLVSGLATSNYTDATLTNTNAYSYVVTAYGPMGSGLAVSDPVGVTTLDCGAIQPTPVLSIVSFEGLNSASLAELRTKVLRPAFTGTTNIPNAIIDILVHSTQIVSDQVTANGAGYWTWTPAIDLETGEHTITVTATDPLDITRTIITTTNFIIEKESSGSGDNDNDQKKKKKPEVIIPGIIRSVLPSIPFDFTMQSSAPSVYQGDTLDVSLEVLRIDPRYVGGEAVISYDVVSPEGHIVTHAESSVRLGEHAVFASSMTLPLSIEPNDGYRIRASVIFGKYIVTREVSLSVAPLPILQLGGGVAVTLPQLVAFSGWIALILLSLLFLWLFLFIREYWMYLHAWRHITEQQLIRLGFFGRTGKGVSG